MADSKNDTNYDLFHIGDTVQIIGLHTEKYNKQFAVIRGPYLIDTERWPVETYGDIKEKLAVKSVNLQRVMAISYKASYSSGVYGYYYYFDDEKQEKKSLEEQAEAFVLTRYIQPWDSEEGRFRKKHDEDIQNKRWKWYQDNIELFTLILQKNGFDLEDIKCSIDKTKPLGMKQAFYDAFKRETFRSMNAAKTRINSEFGKELKFRIVLQGSYVPGYSSNPLKGERYIPNYLFLPSKKSDYDFRCYAQGLDEYVEYLRKNGKDIADRSAENSPHIIRPESVVVILSEIADLQKTFEKLSTKFIGKAVRLQITVFTKNIEFDPNPWDMEITED